MAKIATKRLDTDQGIVRFEFANGEVLEVNVAQLPESIRRQALLHGVSQKVGDAYAGAESAEEALEAARSVVERLMAGEWRTTRQGSGKPRSTMLAEALSRLTGRDVAECQERIAALDDAAVKALRKHPQIQAELAKIRAERLAAKAEAGADSAPDLAELL